jgi:hypothetical protein
MWNLSDSELPPGEVKKRERSRETARNILENRSEDPTEGGVFFYSGPKPPGVFMPKGLKAGTLAPTTTLGETKFLREIPPVKQDVPKRTRR